MGSPTSPIYSRQLPTHPSSDRSSRCRRSLLGRPAARLHSTLVRPVGYSLFGIALFLTIMSPAFGEGVPDSERAALIALYEDTDGDNWSHSDNWLRPAGTESDWFGVTVENGHVVSISMTNSGMVGEIPSELADLPYLQILEFRYAPPLYISIEGPPPNHLALPSDIGSLAPLQVLAIASGNLASLPASIVNLINLVDLDLSGNELADLPDTLGGLVSLETLDLESNEFESLSTSIGQLPNLRSLNLQRNPLLTLPPEIGELENLEVLELGSCQLQSLPSSIGNLRNLTDLNLEYNDLTSLPEEIGNLVKISHLQTSHNLLATVPAGIGGMTGLQRVDLNDNLLTSLPHEIGNLKNVDHFYANDNHLTEVPAGIGGMENLQVLSLSRNDLSSLPPEIGNLKNVDHFYANDNHLTEVPAGIGGMENLQVLSLSQNLLSSLPEEIGDLDLLSAFGAANNNLQSLPEGIGRLTSLFNLSLSNNQLTSLPHEFGQLGALWRLDLHANSLTELPAEFGQLQALEGLDLSSNEFSSIPSPLFQLTDLTELSLQDNHLEGPLPAEIGSWQNLETLDLSSNRLAGVLPRELKDLTSLDQLNLDYNALRAGNVSMVGFLRNHLWNEYEQWFETQTQLPNGLGLHALNADTIEIRWTDTPGWTDAIVLYFSSVTSDRAGLTYSGIEVNRSERRMTLTGLRLGKDYHFAVRGVALADDLNRNTVETELSYVFNYAVPAVLPVYIPLAISNALQFTGVSVTNLSSDPAHLEFAAMGLNGEVLPLARNPADLLLPAYAQRARLLRELFETVPAGPFWVRMTTDNGAVASLSMIGNFRLSELDGYLPMVLPSQDLDFPRVYEGLGVFHGQWGATRLALVNPAPDPVSLRLTLRGPGPNQQFEEPDALLIEPATFTIPPEGLLTGTISELFQQSLDVTSGDVRVEILQGNSLVGASLVEFPGTLMAVTGDPPLPAHSGYAPSIMTGASGPLGVFTNLKMINRGNYWYTGKLTATGQSGALLGKSADVGLWPHRSWERDLGDLLEIQNAEDRIQGGALAVDFVPGVRPANVIVGERGQLRFATAFPLQTQPFTEAVFPHLASTPSIFTGLALFNPSDRTSHVIVEVYGSEGSLLGSESIDLGVHEQVSQLISELFPDLGSRTAGYIRVVAEEPIVGAEIFADWALNYYSAVPPALVSPIPIAGAHRLPAETWGD